MSRLHAISALAPVSMTVAAVLVLVAPCTGTVGDDPFTIESFIPEKFKDMEWQLNTNTNLAGDDEDRLTLLQSNNEYRARYKTDSEHETVGIQSYNRYRYETIPKFLTLALTSSASYGYGRSHEGGEQAYVGSLYFCNSSEGRIETSYFSARPHIESGLYFSGDFFVSIASDLDLRYTDSPISSLDEKDSVWTATNPEDGRTSVEVGVSRNNAGYDSRQYEIDLSFTPGWGRVYDGAFASMPMYMIDELRENHLLASEPSADQMLSLCELIYQYRLEHYIDFRLHRIETLDAVCSFLVLEGIIHDAGPLAYFLIQDVWSYYPDLPEFSRKFGFSVRAGLGYDAYYYNGHMVFDGVELRHETRLDNGVSEIVG